MPYPKHYTDKELSAMEKLHGHFHGGVAKPPKGPPPTPNVMHTPMPVDDPLGGLSGGDDPLEGIEEEKPKPPPPAKKPAPKKKK